MFRTPIRCALLGLCFLTAAASARADAAECKEQACRTSAKPAPLDLMKFIRGGAPKSASSIAATSGKSLAPKTAAPKTAAPKTAATHAVAQGKPIKAVGRTPRDARAARLPSPALPESASGYAPPSTDVEVVQADSLNAIDLAAGRAPADIFGQAFADVSAPNLENVRLVSANEINDVDRKSVASEPSPLRPSGTAAARPESWMENFWTAVGARLVGLTQFLR